MNPFDLSGPPFLLFYVAFSIAVLFGMHFVRKSMESGDSPAFDTSDPYLIATLRGGGNEAVRVATVSLIERNLLATESTGKCIVQKAASRNARAGFERAVVAYFEKSSDPAGLFKDVEVMRLAREHEDRLAGIGALPSQNQKVMRFLVWLASLAFLYIVGATKIMIAIERGRSNYLFLILLMIAAAIISLKVAFPRLTSLGSAMVQDLQALFARLKPNKTSKARANATEASLIAAVFGIAALPALAYPYLYQVFPRASVSSGSSCGTSSSDSGGDSGGGDGGGGCGGGCGGCGGGD